MTDTKAVVFATVCSKCEALVGKEEVKHLSQPTITELLATEPENFFQYKDPRYQSEYRRIFSQDGCRNC